MAEVSLTDVLAISRFDKAINAHFTTKPTIIPISKVRIFRPSGLYKFCPVEAAFAIKIIQAAAKKNVHAFVQSTQLPGHLTQIVDTGTVIHKQLQYYAGLLGFAKRGQWRCPACGFFTHKTVPMPVTGKKDHFGPIPLTHDYPARCPKCRGKNLGMFPPWLFVEPELEEDVPDVELQLRARGSIDQVWELPCPGNVGTLPVIVDYKTINEQGFNEDYGTLPKKDNVIQMQGYLGLASEDPMFKKRFGEIKWGLLDYYNKNKSTHKYFPVPRDLTVWGALKEKMHWARIAGSSKATSKAAMKRKPDFRVCSNVKHKRARACIFSYQCWGKKAPANWLA